MGSNKMRNTMGPLPTRRLRPSYNMLAVTAILLVSSFLQVVLVSGRQDSGKMSLLRGQARTSPQEQEQPQQPNARRQLKSMMGKRGKRIEDDDAVGRRGYPVRCIVMGRPVNTVSVGRRRPVIRDRTKPGFARVQRRGFNDGGNLAGDEENDNTEYAYEEENNDDLAFDEEHNTTSSGQRKLQRSQGGGGREVFWPSVESEEDCFFGVFAIRTGASATRPPGRGEPGDSGGSDVGGSDSGTLNFYSPGPTLGAGPSTTGATTATSATAATTNSTLPPGRQGANATTVTTAANGTAAPTGAVTTRNLVFDTVSRNVQTTLNFGFFFGTAVRAPSQAEITGMLAQINNFYTKVMRDSGYNPTFTELQVSLVSSNFDPTKVATSENDPDKYPVSLVMNFVFLFLDSSAVTSVQVPTADQVIALVENADYLNFIENYAWVAAPANGLFFETQVVQYGVVSL